MIDNDTYELESNNFYNIPTHKNKIVLGSSMSHDMGYINGWKNRRSGEYKKTAAYSIDIDGKVYEHFDPDYYSEFIDDDIDKNIVLVNIVNEGYLNKVVDKKEYRDWMDRVYTRDDDPIMKKWRNQKFWAPYSIEQIKSAKEIAEYLFNRFDIKRNIIGHNTKVKSANTFEGLLYRSNFNEYMTDLSPAWPCREFKEMFKDD